VERSDHARWDNDLVSFRFILRTDGDLVDTGPTGGRSLAHDRRPGL